MQFATITGHRFVPFCCGLVELSAVAHGQWKGTKLSEGLDTTGRTNHVDHAKSKPRRFMYDLLLQQPTGPTISLVLIYRALCFGLFMTCSLPWLAVHDRDTGGKSKPRKHRHSRTPREDDNDKKARTAIKNETPRKSHSLRSCKAHMRSQLCQLPEASQRSILLELRSQALYIRLALSNSRKIPAPFIWCCTIFERFVYCARPATPAGSDKDYLCFL